MTSTLAMSREKLAADGWHVETVEQTIRVPGRVFKRDLFGFGDLLAIRGGERLIVQATSYTNVSARVSKIAESELVGLVRDAGFGIVVHGWRKVKGRWQCREVDCS